MNDTDPRIEKIYRNMLMSKSPFERLQMACSMFDTAKEIVTSSIMEKKPDISASDLRCEIFLQLYGPDFSPPQKEKILSYLRNH